MPADLSNKRCIVTGGATGIGKASAIRTAELGAQVAIFDNNNEAGNNTAIEINDKGGNCRFWSVDVRDEANVLGTVSAAKSWLGDIDVLLHFAGVLQGASVDLEDFPEKTWDTVLDINPPWHLLNGQVRRRRNAQETSRRSPRDGDSRSIRRRS